MTAGVAPTGDYAGATPAAAPLSRAAIAIYALPAATTGFMGSLISFYLLKFSTDVLLIAPALMGFLFGLSRLWDAVTDPLAGYWSDRTRSRLGRRRPWLLAAALPLALSFAALWSPPRSLAGSSLALWMGVGILLFYSAQTVLNVPHAALGAELTSDHHDRTRVFGGRLLVDLCGVLLAAGALYLLERSVDVRATATAVAAAAAVVALGLILLSTVRVRERAEYQGRGGTSSIAAFRDVLGNPHARLLIAVFFLEWLGFAGLTTVLPYVTQYLLQMPGMTSVFLGSAIAVMVASVPIWIPLSRRFGKRELWIASMAIRAAAFGAIFFVPPGAWVPLLVAVVVIGSTHGCGAVVGPSIKADVIDFDEYRSGQRKEGAYFATWNLATKGGAGFAIIVTGFALQATGFEPNAEQSGATLLVLRALLGAVPCLLFALATALLVRFSLDEREHARIRAAIAARAESS